MFYLCYKNMQNNFAIKVVLKVCDYTRERKERHFSLRLVVAHLEPEKYPDVPKAQLSPQGKA